MSASIVSGRVVATEMTPLPSSSGYWKCQNLPATSCGLDLEVGDGGLEARVPIDQALVAIEQALAVEIDEHLEDGAAEALVHGEALVRPVARGAEPAELAGDRAAALGLPFPDLGDELLAAEIGALLLPLVELALDHHLGGDAGMVHADHPERVLALQPRVADEDVLQRDRRARGRYGASR